MNENTRVVKDENGIEIGYVFPFDNGVGSAWGFSHLDGRRANEYAHMTAEKAEEALLRVVAGGSEYVRTLRRRSF